MKAPAAKGKRNTIEPLIVSDNKNTIIPPRIDKIEDKKFRKIAVIFLKPL